jgi:hypothetical protein
MQSDKRYLRGCKRQNKGVRIVTPSDNLTKAYLEKSRNVLKSMEVNANAGISEWAISAAYYARYFAVYALLSKIGAKCEIHDCTIALFNYLFGSAVQADMVEQLRQSSRIGSMLRGGLAYNLADLQALVTFGVGRFSKTREQRNCS